MKTNWGWCSMNFDIENVEAFKKVIEDIVDARLKNYGITSFVAAIITQVNDDGTVNVMIPPDNKRYVNNVLNKSNETLAVGDSVELCTKNGRLSNSWVALKHGNTTSLESRVKWLEDNALTFVATGEYEE